MSFNLILQNNASEPIAVTKEITDIATVLGELKDETSIIDPIILIQGNISDFASLNYVTIPNFNRSYFVREIESFRTNLIQLTCHVDVLSSFADEIKANRGIVKRAEGANAYNLYINDDSLVSYQDPYILTEPFPNGFTGHGFILAVAAG